MVRPSKRLKPGARVCFGSIEAELGGYLDGGLREVTFADAESVARARAEAGELPLPPYIRPAGQDLSRYQTTFAQIPGSVAAPTAGLHFEADDFHNLTQRGVVVVDVSLDVGAGTFSPIREEDVRKHSMHAETFRIAPEQAARLQRARQQGCRVVSLGTTAMRVLESLPDCPGWEDGLEASTKLYVLPGYHFRMVDALVTNFHLPRSSLLLLVSAFARRSALMAAYQEALREGFRFFSFGDCMWIR
jgi:S-adenosylmethionine:tRNA ribosyltransferase-isomerase